MIFHHYNFNLIKKFSKHVYYYKHFIINMLYIPKINDYLKIVAEEEVKDFAAINFSECFKSMREKLYSKLNKEQNLRKIAKSLISF